MCLGSFVVGFINPLKCLWFIKDFYLNFIWDVATKFYCESSFINSILYNN